MQEIKSGREKKVSFGGLQHSNFLQQPGNPPGSCCGNSRASGRLLLIGLLLTPHHHYHHLLVPLYPHTLFIHSYVELTRSLSPLVLVQHCVSFLHVILITTRWVAAYKCHSLKASLSLVFPKGLHRVHRVFTRTISLYKFVSMKRVIVHRLETLVVVADISKSQHINQTKTKQK